MDVFMWSVCAREPRLPFKARRLYVESTTSIRGDGDLATSVGLSPLSFDSLPLFSSPLGDELNSSPLPTPAPFLGCKP